MNDVKNSQNFLHSQKLLDSLMARCDVSSNDLILEIGPGKGIITDALLRIGCRVIAIEMDRSLFNVLKNRYLNNEHVRIICGDFLESKLPSEKYKVFSNIPFNVTAAIMKKLLAATTPPDDMYLIMQQEAFYKYAGMPFSSNGLRSLMYKPWFIPEIVHSFQPTDFDPVPQARIVLAHFKLKSQPDVQNTLKSEYLDFLSFVFMEPGESFSEKFKRLFSYEQQKRIKRNCSIGDTSISNWSYEQWLVLFEAYQKVATIERKTLVVGSNNRLIKQQDKLQKVHRNRARFS